MKIRPQILTAILAVTILGGLVTWLVPAQVDKVVGGVVATIGMLGMKLLENE